MAGIIFLATVAFWLYGSFWLAFKLGNLVSHPQWRTATKTTILIILLAAPFVDEVIGKYQFEALCRANGIESADVSKARGKKVKIEYGAREFVTGTIMPIKQSNVLLIELESNIPMINYKNYYALGGWLMRNTRLSMGSSEPILFNGNGCGLVQKDHILQRNNISQVN